jgi:uncharacterized membrane protein
MGTRRMVVEPRTDDFSVSSVLRIAALGVSGSFWPAFAEAAAANTAYNQGSYGVGNYGGLEILSATGSGSMWLGVGSALLLGVSAGLFVWLRRRRTSGKAPRSVIVPQKQ